MNYTGERVIPKQMDPLNNLLLEHIGRYHFSVNYVTGRVLDIACGVGYGSFLVAKYRKKTIDSILGLDSDPATIAYAKKHYHHPSCQFQVENALDPNLPKKYGKFDTIISFETLEHLDDDLKFIDNLYQLLNPNGKLIISTPLGAGRDIPSKQPFHNFQLTEAEFLALFKPFRQATYFQQHGLVFQPYNKETSAPIMIAVAKK